MGTFRITAGTCSGSTAAGSRFRMVVPSGGANGPYVSNNNSTCGDQTYTPLAPGTDGGIVTGGYQPEPDPAFDGSGNSLAARITKPTQFYGVAFSTSTNPVDPQTAVKVGAPTVSVANGKLTGDLRAFAASWNRQEFNQGAPKPDGTSPGNTAAPSGTYNSSTGAFTLDWASLIQGGPFNNFTGQWHLEGTFTPAQGSTNATTATTAPNAGPPTTTSGNSGSSAGTGSGTVAKPTGGATTTTAASSTAAASGPSSTVGTLVAAEPTDASGETDASKNDAPRALATNTSEKSSGVGLFAVLAAIALFGAAGGAWYVLRRRGQTGP